MGNIMGADALIEAIYETSFGGDAKIGTQFINF